MSQVVVVIDADPNTRALIELALRALGLRVEAVGEGRAGVRRAQARRPALILLDDRLPDLSPPEVLRRLRRSAKAAATPVVVLSALLPERDVVAFGGDALLRKPFEIEDLEGLVRRCLHLPSPDPSPDPPLG